MGFFFGWLILAILVGAFGSSRGRSGFGWFLIAVLLSPLIGWLILLVIPDLRREEARREADQQRQREHQEQLSAIKTARAVAATPAASVADDLTKLANLLERGLLTEAEFQAQKAALLGAGPAPSAGPGTNQAIQEARKYGITFDDRTDRHIWRGNHFKRLEDAVAYARANS